jgi:hypothetical protein
MKEDKKITLDQVDLLVYMVCMFGAGFVLGIIVFT